MIDPTQTLVLSALVMGITGGAHCVAMCGGVSSVICAGGRAKKGGRFTIAYNTGRVASYAVLGLFAGWLGAAGEQLGMRFGGVPLDAVRFGLRALAAVCLLTVGLHLAGLPSFVRVLESAGAPIWRRIAPFAKRLLPLRSPWQAMAAGGLWAFMPCGLLYGAVALAASAGSATNGAMTMAAFGLGTLPVMLGVGVLADRVVRAMARGWVRRSAGVIVLAMGLWSTVGLAQQIGLGRSPACCPHR